MVRQTLALLAGAIVAVVGAAVLGEYGFDGWAVIGSGLLTGLFVGEGILAVARRGSPLLAAGSAVLAAASLLWAGWISTGHRLGTVTWWGWAGVALAAAAGALRVRPPAAARRSRSATAAPE